jgi:hypothetical protein
MSFTESIGPQPRDAALGWFLLRQAYDGQVGELGDGVGHKSFVAPGGEARGTLMKPLPRGGGNREADRRLADAGPPFPRTGSQRFGNSEELKSSEF